MTEIEQLQQRIEVLEKRNADVEYLLKAEKVRQEFDKDKATSDNLASGIYALEKQLIAGQAKMIASLSSMVNIQAEDISAHRNAIQKIYDHQLLILSELEKHLNFKMTQLPPKISVVKQQ